MPPALEWCGTRVCQSQIVHQNDIVDIGKITTILTVTIDDGTLMRHQFLHEQRNDSRVCAIRILTTTKDIEIAQANGVKTVSFGKYIGIQLVDVFGHGIR